MGNRPSRHGLKVAQILALLGFTAAYLASLALLAVTQVRGAP
ncbi:hypothetical protein [Pseudoduganella chitinolytica]|uniref:Uncharacterized protein n=1 Tax=Pseudoduganella chitinolytica TaxID=34070 RepID=A0ABY8B5L6_9BURK|nr:hypothetical protein [Pseudoduganella chitinolytica]WEF31031.1 hypothetical protein PX653_16305 [Pseudoduganella chitinolytica]